MPLAGTADFGAQRPTKSSQEMYIYDLYSMVAMGRTLQSESADAGQFRSWTLKWMRHRLRRGRSIKTQLCCSCALRGP